MVDVVRSLAALKTLFVDNVAGDISAQDGRDLLVSSYGPTLLHSAKASADDPPDDEFDDTTGMSGATNGLDAKWTAVSGTKAAVDILESADVARYDFDTIPGSMLLQAGNNGSQLVALRQDFTLADGDCLTMALFPGLSGERANNEMWIGMSLNDNDSGYSAGTYMTFHVENNGEPSILVYNGSVQGDHSWTPIGTNVVYLRVVRSGTSYYFMYSMTGHVWQHLTVETISTAPDNLWIFADNQVAYAHPPAISQVAWIRKGAGGLDPWTWRAA